MIYVIGIGPGGADQITPKALEALSECDVIAGYSRYIDLLRELLPQKKFMSYPMRSERERCKEAIALSREGHKVAIVSSGDSGVYGMAGLVLELSGENDDVKIIAGIPAADSCAAVLGAPLMNDYVTISLSDLLTSWEVIERRLECACEGDFVICLYNPASRHRPYNFRKACEILLRYKSPDTPSGFVRNAGREGEYSQISTLGQLKSSDMIDMLCTVIIGNSETYVKEGRLITPRGYRL